MILLVLKSCFETVLSFKSQNNKLLEDLRKSELTVLGYKKGLESVEERLEFFKKNESDYVDNINILKVELFVRDELIKELRMRIEIAHKEKDQVQKEKESIQLRVNMFEHASESVNKLIEC